MRDVKNADRLVACFVHQGVSGEGLREASPALVLAPLEKLPVSLDTLVVFEFYI